MDSKSGIGDPDPENSGQEAENNLSSQPEDSKPEGILESVEDKGATDANTGDGKISTSLNKRDRLHRLFKATLSAEPDFENIREKIKKNKINKILSGAWDILGKIEPGKESRTSKVPGMVRVVRERLDKIHGEIIRISTPLKLTGVSRIPQQEEIHPGESEAVESSLPVDPERNDVQESIETKRPKTDNNNETVRYQGEGGPEVY